MLLFPVQPTISRAAIVVKSSCSKKAFSKRVFSMTAVAIGGLANAVFGKVSPIHHDSMVFMSSFRSF